MADDKLEGRRSKKSFLDKRLRNKELRKLLDEGELKIGVAEPFGIGGRVPMVVRALKGMQEGKFLGRVFSSTFRLLKNGKVLQTTARNPAGAKSINVARQKLTQKIRPLSEVPKKIQQAARRK